MGKVATTTSLFSLVRIIKAFYYAICGLRSVFISEIAFRQEVFLSFLIIPLGYYLGNNFIEKTLLIASWILVLIIEVINSALETIIDRVGNEIHPLSKKAKDAGSAAVFLSIFNMAIVWGILFFSKI